jgi:hypothetical protein
MNVNEGLTVFYFIGSIILLVLAIVIYIGLKSPKK